MRQMRQALKYLNYWQGAKTRHAVHSPFVYELASVVFKKAKRKQAHAPIEALRKQLLTDNRAIDVVDFGAGSKVNSSNQRRIAEIVKTSSIRPKYGRLLHELAAHLCPSTVLEVGTSMGFATMYLSTAAPGAKVYTMEGSSKIAELALANFDKLDIRNIQLEVGPFDTTLPELLEKTGPLDMVFFDGNHRKKATLDYFEWCLEKASKDAVFIFDDIYWSGEMEEAWKTIKKHPEVSVTIDLFQMGMAFFRPGQAKQDFILRY